MKYLNKQLCMFQMYARKKNYNIAYTMNIYLISKF